MPDFYFTVSFLLGLNTRCWILVYVFLIFAKCIPRNKRNQSSFPQITKNFCVSVTFVLQNGYKNIHILCILCGMTDHQGQIILTVTESREPESRLLFFSIFILSNQTVQWYGDILSTPASQNKWNSKQNAEVALCCMASSVKLSAVCQRHWLPAPGARHPAPTFMKGTRGCLPCPLLFCLLSALSSFPQGLEGCFRLVVIKQNNETHLAVACESHFLNLVACA